MNKDWIHTSNGWLNIKTGEVRYTEPTDAVNTAVRVTRPQTVRKPVFRRKMNGFVNGVLWSDGKRYTGMYGGHYYRNGVRGAEVTKAQRRTRAQQASNNQYGVYLNKTKPEREHADQVIGNIMDATRPSHIVQSVVNVANEIKDKGVKKAATDFVFDNGYKRQNNGIFGPGGIANNNDESGEFANFLFDAVAPTAIKNITNAARWYVSSVNNGAKELADAWKAKNLQTVSYEPGIGVNWADPASPSFEQRVNATLVPYKPITQQVLNNPSRPALRTYHSPQTGRVSIAPTNLIGDINIGPNTDIVQPTDSQQNAFQRATDAVNNHNIVDSSGINTFQPSLHHDTNAVTQESQPKAVANRDEGVDIDGVHYSYDQLQNLTEQEFRSFLHQHPSATWSIWPDFGNSNAPRSIVARRMKNVSNEPLPLNEDGSIDFSRINTADIPERVDSEIGKKLSVDDIIKYHIRVRDAENPISSILPANAYYYDGVRHVPVNSLIDDSVKSGFHGVKYFSNSSSTPEDAVRMVIIRLLNSKYNTKDIKNIFDQQLSHNGVFLEPGGSHFSIDAYPLARMWQYKYISNPANNASELSFDELNKALTESKDLVNGSDPYFLRGNWINNGTIYESLNHFGSGGVVKDMPRLKSQIREATKRLQLPGYEIDPYTGKYIIKKAEHFGEKPEYGDTAFDLVRTGDNTFDAVTKDGRLIAGGIKTNNTPQQIIDQQNEFIDAFNKRHPDANWKPWIPTPDGQWIGAPTISVFRR